MDFRLVMNIRTMMKALDKPSFSRNIKGFCCYDGICAGKIFPVQEARKQVEILMEQMVKKQGATEELKAQDQMKWVRLMINIKSSAEEIVVKNTIYM